ncbi:UNVERIFIED_CONTAM: hypothetical protein HDU68_010065, partial [Siphonaria sp. JEL0065]
MKTRIDEEESVDEAGDSASAKRGTGICASGACQVAVVDGKNRCSVHQNELDARNALALERDIQYKKRLNELIGEFGAGSEEVKEYKAQNHPTTGNLVKMAEHREIQKRAAEAADEVERKQIMMKISVFANNQLNNGSEKQKAAVRRYNATDAFYASLRKHNRTRKNRADLTGSIVNFLMANKEFVGDSVNLLHAKIAVHDTEYDARGASHADEMLIREFCVMDLETKEILSIRRRLGENRIDIDPPNPAWATVKQQLLDFDAKHNPDFYIAYEKPNHDRNRWETLLGPTDYIKLKHKFADFSRDFCQPNHDSLESVHQQTN